MATIDPRRIADQKDAWVTALYAKTVGATDDDGVLPLIRDSSGYLLINMTVGTVNISSTASTITNAVGNPVNVSLTNTAVTVAGTVSLTSTLVTTSSGTASTITNAVGNPVNVSLTSTAVTVAGSVSLSPTVVTIESTAVAAIQTAVEIVDNMIAGNVARVMGVGVAGTPSGGVLSIQGVSSMTPVDVSLSSTKVTVESAGLNVTLTSTKVTVDNTVTVSPNTTASTITNAAGNPVNVSLTNTKVTVDNTVTASLSNTAVSISTAVTYSTLMLTSKTLTTGSGTLSATNGTITNTPTNRAKVYAISLTTTSASELICVFNSGGVANGVELWRATLMAPAGASAGLNLAVSPPNFLFQSRSGTAVSLSLSSAVLVHYSCSYFDEA